MDPEPVNDPRDIVECHGCIQLLLHHSEPKIDLNARSRSGRTPLIWACKYGHKDIVPWIFRSTHWDLSWKQEIIWSLQKFGKKNRSSQAQAKLKPSLDTPTIYILNKKLSKPKFQSYEVETWYVGTGFMLHFRRLTYKQLRWTKVGMQGLLDGPPEKAQGAC